MTLSALHVFISGRILYADDILVSSGILIHTAVWPQIITYNTYNCFSNKKARRAVSLRLPTFLHNKQYAFLTVTSTYAVTGADVWSRWGQ